MKRQIIVCTLGASTLALIPMTAPANAHILERLVSQPLSRKEVKRLVRHASSPEDYQTLATYFDQKAQSLDAEAEQFDNRADRDASSSGMQRIQPKVPYAGGWVTYCRYLASDYKLKAQKARVQAQHYKACRRDMVDAMFTDRESDSMPRRREIGAATLVNSTLLTRFPVAVLLVLSAMILSAQVAYTAAPAGDRALVV